MNLEKAFMPNKLLFKIDISLYITPFVPKRVKAGARVLFLVHPRRRRVTPTNCIQYNVFRAILGMQQNWRYPIHVFPITIFLQ